VLGIVKWLVLEELHTLCTPLRMLVMDWILPDLWTIKVHQVIVALQLLHNLMRGMVLEAVRMLTFVGVELEPAGLPTTAINLLLANRVVSQEQAKLAQVLVQPSSTMGAAGLDRSFCFALALGFLHMAQHVSL
jgi:hypothetical protein